MVADHSVTETDVAAEGFPGWTPFEFVRFFCGQMRCEPETEVTRVEWRYIDEDTADA